MTGLSDTELIAKYHIKKNDRVLDIGGSAKQHDRIVVDTIVDILSPENTPYRQSRLSSKHILLTDITREKLPFKDKEFDFCLCTHTLEDLDTPFLILDEMSRIAKRGYIATPSRGLDSEFSHLNLTDWLTGFRRVPGLAHHQWFFENRKNNMIITPKNYPLLYTGEFFITKWSGEEEFQYYWENQIEYLPFTGITDFHALISDYEEFMSRNAKFIKKGLPLIYLDNPFYLFKEIAKYFLKRGEGFKKR
jgi:ubiquinone/menaquinone biosynthesis C-methylase UbiE